MPRASSAGRQCNVRCFEYLRLGRKSELGALQTAIMRDGWRGGVQHSAKRFSVLQVSVRSGTRAERARLPCLVATAGHPPHKRHFSNALLSGSNQNDRRMFNTSASLAKNAIANPGGVPSWRRLFVPCMATWGRGTGRGLPLWVSCVNNMLGWISAGNIVRDLLPVYGVSSIDGLNSRGRRAARCLAPSGAVQVSTTHAL